MERYDDKYQVSPRFRSIFIFQDEQCSSQPGQEMAMNAPAGTLQKVRSSMMNAVHDLPLIVARDAGFFRDEGLDVEILKTPGSGQHASDHRALRDDIFKRTLEHVPAGLNRRDSQGRVSGRI
jgi:hypothetical protein